MLVSVSLVPQRPLAGQQEDQMLGTEDDSLAFVHLADPCGAVHRMLDDRRVPSKPQHGGRRAWERQIRKLIVPGGGVLGIMAACGFCALRIGTHAIRAVILATSQNMAGYVKAW